jgi:hypothetical protein
MTRQLPYGQPPFYDNRGAYGPPQYQEPYYQPYLMDIHQMQPNAWPPYGGPDARAHKEFQGYYQPHSMAQGYYENPHPINHLWVPPHMRQIVNSATSSTIATRSKMVAAGDKKGRTKRMATPTPVVVESPITPALTLRDASVPASSNNSPMFSTPMNKTAAGAAI